LQDFRQIEIKAFIPRYFKKLGDIITSVSFFDEHFNVIAVTGVFILSKQPRSWFIKPEMFPLEFYRVMPLSYEVFNAIDIDGDGELEYFLRENGYEGWIHIIVNQRNKKYGRVAKSHYYGH